MNKLQTLNLYVIYNNKTKYKKNEKNCFSCVYLGITMIYAGKIRRTSAGFELVPGLSPLVFGMRIYTKVNSTSTLLDDTLVMSFLRKERVQKLHDLFQARA